MNKKIGELKIKKSEDYYDTVIKTLEDNGFVIVLDYETHSEKNYIIAVENGE